jgi:N-acetylmuramoyl-L-alanine amidase
MFHRTNLTWTTAALLWALLPAVALATQPVTGNAPKMPPNSSRPFTVVIDAGHGGKDGGAVGPKGTLEKSVTLAVARKLERLIKAETSLRAILTRTDDSHVPLSRRAQIAREKQADLFVSLHADAFEDHAAQGASVFILSETGASSAAARTLADRENAGEVGGVNLGAQEADVASVLVDLSLGATGEASEQAAQRIMEALRSEYPLHNPKVQQAGFAVLKSVDVPSLLIEMGFLSNPREEHRLLNPQEQQRLARTIARGLIAHTRDLDVTTSGASSKPAKP